MKQNLRRIAKRITGRPPQKNGKPRQLAPIDTRSSRRNILDLAIIHLQIATRCSESDDGGPRSEFPQDASTPASLRGDYVEFGVFQGETFIHVCKRAERALPWMRFHAFDSFEGLPKPEGIDAGAEFSEGQFACSESEFRSHVSASEVDMSRVSIVPGWFSETLAPTVSAQHGIETVSLAYIDCDLYSSTVPVLEFLTPRVRQGTILCFDDWFCFRADPRRGVQRAAAEWVKQCGNVELIPWQAFCHHGQSFFVSFI